MPASRCAPPPPRHLLGAAASQHCSVTAHSRDAGVNVGCCALLIRIIGSQRPAGRGGTAPGLPGAQVQLAIRDGSAQRSSENGSKAGSKAATGGGGPQVAGRGTVEPGALLPEGAEAALLYVRFRAAAEPGLKGALSPSPVAVSQPVKYAASVAAVTPRSTGCWDVKVRRQNRMCPQLSILSQGRSRPPLALEDAVQMQPRSPPAADARWWRRGRAAAGGGGAQQGARVRAPAGGLPGGVLRGAGEPGGARRARPHRSPGLAAAGDDDALRRRLPHAGAGLPAAGAPIATQSGRI